MVEIILKSVVFGIISTAGIEFIYNIENVVINIMINLAFIVISFVALRMSYIKLKIEEDKKYEEEVKFRYELLKEIKDKSAFEEILKEIRDKSIFEEILEEVRNGEMLKNILKSTENRDIFEDILVEIKDKEIFENILCEVKNKDILQAILNESKDKSMLNNIYKNFKDISVLNEIKEMVEENHSDLLNRMDENRNAVVGFKNNVQSDSEQLMELVESNMKKYNEIQKETLAKLLEISNSNSHSVNLIKDSYSILNNIMDK